MALVVTGTVVTFDAARRVLDPGAVYVGDDGALAAVAASSEPAPSGFAGAPRIDTGGFVYPGLIDLHSHLAYNTLPLWEARGVPYLHHDRWPGEKREPDYASTITWPARVLQQTAAEALIKYVEVKALVGGTTAIQGAPRTTRPVDGWLVRVVDNERFGAGPDLVRVSALQKRPEQLRLDARKLREGGVLIYHVSEGPVGSLVHREFIDLRNTGCLQPGLIGVHATALRKEDFREWQRAVAHVDAEQRGTVVWSPFSNLWLYHQTTDVLEARKQKLRIALGSDWSPSGTKHVLGELKVADLLNRQRFGTAFSDLELCEMVTVNPGDALALAWGPRVGRLQAGAEADLIVVAKSRPDPYRNLIEATEARIELVVVRGQPFYGSDGLMKRAGARGANRITVAGKRRSVVVRMPGRPDATLNWPQVRRVLAAVRRDPVTAWNNSLNALAAWGGPLDAPEAPLVILGDMPAGDLGLLGASGEIPADVSIPPLDSLEHDASFFAAIGRTSAPELGQLASYYA